MSIKNNNRYCFWAQLLIYSSRDYVATSKQEIINIAKKSCYSTRKIKIIAREEQISQKVSDDIVRRICKFL